MWGIEHLLGRSTELQLWHRRLSTYQIPTNVEVEESHDLYALSAVYLTTPGVYTHNGWDFGTDGDKEP